MKKLKLLIAFGVLTLFIGSSFAQTVEHCGHTYETVVLNGRTWLKTNIKVSKGGFAAMTQCCDGLQHVSDVKRNRNGRSPFTYSNFDYAAYHANNKVATPEMSHKRPYVSAFNNDPNDKHGAIFNYYAVEKCNVCPGGFRLPTADEFEQMNKAENLMGRSNRANEDWGAIGRIDGYGSVVRGRFGEYWTSTEDPSNSNKANAFVLKPNTSNISSEDKRTGCYVRCIKEEAVEIPDITKNDGVWTFGWGSPGKQFNEFVGEKKEGPQKQITRKYKENWWSVAQNTSNKAWTDNHHNTYPPKADGAMVFHPGSGRNQSSKAHYTAKTTGTYTFNIKWSLIDAQGDLVSAEVYTNASSRGAGWTKLFKENVTDKLPGRSLSKEFKVHLKAGEVVSVEVENAGTWKNDSTLIEMSAK